MYSKCLDNSESSFLRDASWEIRRPYGISELSREFPSRSFRRGEESRARVTEDQENRSNQLAEDLNPKSILVKDFSDCEELDLMMAAVLKWSYDIAYLFYEITERRAVARQKGEKLVHRAQE